MVIELSRSQKTLCQGHQCICKKKTNNVNMVDLQRSWWMPHRALSNATKQTQVLGAHCRVTWYLAWSEGAEQRDGATTEGANKGFGGQLSKGAEDWWKSTRISRGVCHEESASSNAYQIVNQSGSTQLWIGIWVIYGWHCPGFEEDKHRSSCIAHVYANGGTICMPALTPFVLQGCGWQWQTHISGLI